MVKSTWSVSVIILNKKKSAKKFTKKNGTQKHSI